MQRSTLMTAFILIHLFSSTNVVRGHGRMMDPPARNSMWRYGFPNPVNYNDNELFCGGYAVQWELNQGRCGVCGDPYDMQTPRPHEAGGEYGKGIITKRYFSGQQMEVEIDLTANHYGIFELKLCPNNNPRSEATQECFDKYPLIVSKTGEERFVIPPDTEKQAVITYSVRLPKGVTCSQCVLQWTYRTGNMWGVCANGTESVGCGKAETFRNCADIIIFSGIGSGVPPLFVQQKNPFLLYYKDLRAGPDMNVFPLIVRDQVCLPTKQYRRFLGMENWCQVNCLRYPPNCPSSLCYCPTTCEAIGSMQGKEGADVYCLDKCLTYGSDCPEDRCRCY